MVLLLLVFPIRYLFFGPTPVTSPLVIADTDPLCVYVADTLHFKCVVVLAAESLLGPGNIVAGNVSDSAYDRVALPQSNLFSSACLVPGAESEVDEIRSELAKQSATNTLDLEEFGYTLNRDFGIGVNLPVPQYAGAVLKAGPKLNEVQTVTFKAPHAWLKMIDENQIIALLQHAAIRDTCIDRLIAKAYRVVAKAAVAQGFDVIVIDRAGKSMSLSAAVKQGKVDVGGTAGTSLDETIKRTSESPVVVGVDFFDSTIFKEARASLVKPLFSASGQTQVQARGDQGAVIQDQIRSAPLGNSLSFHSQGGNLVNQCGSGTPPRIDLAGGLTVKDESPGQQRFEVGTTGTIQGGAGTRREFPNRCISIPSSVEAKIAFDANLSVTVRSSNASQLRIEDNGVYAVSAELKDWKGENRPREVANNSAPRAVLFKLDQAGVYQVHVSGTRTIRAQGDGVVTIRDQGAFSVDVVDSSLPPPKTVNVSALRSEAIQPASSPQPEPQPCQANPVYIHWHRPGNGGEEVSDTPDRYMSVSISGAQEAVTLQRVSLSGAKTDNIAIVSDSCSNRQLKDTEYCNVTLTCAVQSPPIPDNAFFNVSAVTASCGSITRRQDISSICGRP